MGHREAGEVLHVQRDAPAGGRAPVDLERALVVEFDGGRAPGLRDLGRRAIRIPAVLYPDADRLLDIKGNHHHLVPVGLPSRELGRLDEPEVAPRAASRPADARARFLMGPSHDLCRVPAQGVREDDQRTTTSGPQGRQRFNGPLHRGAPGGSGIPADGPADSHPDAEVVPAEERDHHALKQQLRSREDARRAAASPGDVPQFPPDREREAFRVVLVRAQDEGKGGCVRSSQRLLARFTRGSFAIQRAALSNLDPHGLQNRYARTRAPAGVNRLVRASPIRVAWKQRACDALLR
ncbi:hypothetical protein COSO111634_35265 [Corallococcus soli]